MTSTSAQKKCSKRCKDGSACRGLAVKNRNVCIAHCKTNSTAKNLKVRKKRRGQRKNKFKSSNSDEYVFEMDNPLWKNRNCRDYEGQYQNNFSYYD